MTRFLLISALAIACAGPASAYENSVGKGVNRQTYNSNTNTTTWGSGGGSKSDPNLSRSGASGSSSSRTGGSWNQQKRILP